MLENIDHNQGNMMNIDENEVNSFKKKNKSIELNTSPEKKRGRRKKKFSINKIIHNSGRSKLDENLNHHLTRSQHTNLSKKKLFEQSKKFIANKLYTKKIHQRKNNE